MANVEILVHISAPSRGQDDARYRALAQAYLQFSEPATRQRIGVVTNEVLNDDVDTQAETQILEELLSSAPEEPEPEPESWASYQPDEEDEDHEDEDEYQESELVPTQPETHDHPYKLKSLESPLLSFKSAANNANSPALGRRHVTCTTPPRSRRDDETQNSSNSTQGPPSTIPDSQPEYKKALEVWSSPTTMLELLLQQIDNSSQDTGETHIQRGHNSIGETPSDHLSSQLSHRPNSQRLETIEEQAGSTESFPSSPPLARPGDVNVTIASPILGNPTSSAELDAGSPTASACLSSSIPFPPLSSIEIRPSVLASGVPAVTLDLSTSSSFSKEKHAETRSSRRSSRIARNLLISGVASSVSATNEHKETLSPDQTVPSTDIQVPDTHKVIRKAEYSSFSSNLSMSSIPGKIVPETPYHLPPSTQVPVNGAKRSWPGMSSSDAHASASAPPTVKPVSSSLDSPSSKRRRLEKASSDLMSSSIPEIATPTLLALPPLERKGLLRTTSDQSTPSNSANSAAVAGMSSPMRDLLKESYLDKFTVSPPPPPTSSMNIDPSSFITHPLSDIAKKVLISKHYKPLSQTRDLRPTERGYWLINSHSWPLDLRHRAWNYLGNFIAASRAGWGVRCERNDDFTSFRVYCWGILVPYIYLLLFLASEMKVKKVEAVWIGGNGMALISMPVMK
jgi:hypothetical protein